MCWQFDFPQALKDAPGSPAKISAVAPDEYVNQILTKMNYVKTEPRFDSLHSDPRWQLLLRRMKLPVDSDRDKTVK